jgi:hypothetical protein
MMRFRSNFLANIFNFLGDALEDFNPAAFRFLSAVLPYLSPVPVAWLTADSASKFLNFTPEISFVFVFCLEGIGLWFTSLLVDAVVEWVRSHNWRSFVPVILFLLAVGSYVYLLVNLNVTLEQAKGDTNPLLSRVVTLMCFLPLITGIGNGYGKLKLERKTDMETEKVRQFDLEKERERIRAEQEFRALQERNALDLEKERIHSAERLQKAKLKSESSRKLPESSTKVSNLSESYENLSGNLPENYPKDWRKLRKLLTHDDVQNIAHLDAEGVKRVAHQYHVDERTVINWRLYAKKELGVA